MKNIYIMLVAAFMATGCMEYLPEDILLPMEDISLTIKGEEIMKFDENSCQLGYNNRKNEFRILNDNLTNWIILDCDITPSSTGQKIVADLEYTTENDVKTLPDLVLTVEKIDEDGLVWLWGKDKSIGLVIKVL